MWYVYAWFFSHVVLLRVCCRFPAATLHHVLPCCIVVMCCLLVLISSVVVLPPCCRIGAHSVAVVNGLWGCFIGQLPIVEDC